MKDALYKIKNICQAMAVFLIALSVPRLVFFIANRCVWQYAEAAGWTEETFYGVIGGVAYSAALFIVSSMLVTVLAGFWYGYMRRAEDRKREWRRLCSIRMAAALLLLVLSMEYIASYLMLGLENLNAQWMEDYLELFASAGMGEEGTPVIMLVYTVLAAPVSEELAFRGVCLGKLRRAVPFWRANLLQALLFAVFHMNLMQGCYAFFLGLLLGYTVKISGSLLISAAFHMAFNFIGNVCYRFLPDYTGDNVVFQMLEFALVGAAFAVGIWMLEKGTVRSEED